MKQIEAIAGYWRQAGQAVVFTGAGMSTESGLPDFRSAQGLWKQRPESLATLEALRTQPEEFYGFYQWRIANLWGALPNAGHIALAELQQTGYLAAVITQNVDGLHQRAGAQDVIEVHGTLRTVRCLQCGAGYDSRQLLPVKSPGLQSGPYSAECRCPRCHGWLRPDVVLFGEQLPGTPWRQAMSVSSRTRFFIVAGSSLAVAPANYCPQAALDNGAKLLIINHEPTPFDHLADWVVRQSCAQFLAALQKKLKE